MKQLLQKIKEIEYNNFYPLFFTIIFILILIQYSFNSLDAIFYDLWIRGDVNTTDPQKIVIVAMDEESDQFLGEIYPYTYASHVRFMKRLLKDNPAIINYMVPFLGPESEVEKRNAEEFYSDLQLFKQKGGYFRFGTDRDAWGEQIPPENLIDLGYSLAILNQDGTIFARDNVTRRAILNISGDDSMHLWTANKYRELKGKSRQDANTFKGSYYDSESDATFVLFKYSANPNNYQAIKSIPFHRVQTGSFPAGFFKDKIVLIGPSYVARSDDFVFTPYGKESVKSPKLNVHAQIINSLVNSETIMEVNPWITDIIAIVIAIFLSFIISKVQPTKGLLITMGLMFGMFMIAFGLFTTFGLWVKLSHIILSIFVVYYIWIPFRAIGEYQTRFAIQEEAKMLKKVDNLKQNFISLMSHDLKTPVAKIAGIADILRAQYQNNTKQNELLDNIVQSTKELNNFITSILDLTKIESRNLSLNLENKDINTLLDTTIDKLKFEANANNMTLEKELEPLYPIKVDTVLINRVFANIIGNAIKYAGDGSIIKIRTWDDEQWVYIEIADNGKGIKEEDLDNIFEKFYRVKNDESHKIKGSGLGLYLVKYFVELHHGQISATSVLGEGTTFTVKLKNA